MQEHIVIYIMLAICEHCFFDVTKDFTAFFDEGFVRKSVFAVNGLCISRFFAIFAQSSVLKDLYMDAIKRKPFGNNKQCHR